MTKAELIRRLRDLELDFTKRVFELEQHQSELKAQQAELVESQRELEVSRDRYADLYDFAPVGYVSLDGNGVIGEVNLSGARLLGTERAHLIGIPFVTFVTASDRRAFLDHLVRCRREERSVVVHVDLTLRTRDGRDVPVEFQSHRAGTAESFTVSTALIDLTERHRAEAKRQQATVESERIRQSEKVFREASETKDRFLAMLSHELRAPLASISFALGAIRERGDIPPSLLNALQMINRNVALEARLIDELLDVTRIQRGKLNVQTETVDVHAILDDVTRMSAGEADVRAIEIGLDLRSPAHHVDADPVRLRQVFWNLVDNAFKHTPRGGRVTLGSTSDREGIVSLFVRDTGEGVPPGMEARLFEPFEQGGAPRGGSGGLGLGLAICRGIIEAHAGQIRTVTPRDGKGSLFVVTLPTVAAPVVPAAERPPIALSTNGPRRVLLVEDNADNATAIAEFLKVRGYDVRVAGSVVAALRMAMEGFDVLVSDIGLPDGTGRDIVRRLRENGTVAAIALSGYGTQADMLESREAGFYVHLTKPVDPEQLIDAIERVAAEQSRLAG